MSDFFAARLGTRADDAPNPLDWASIVRGDLSTQAAAWSVPEAFFAILLAAINCDGDLARVENDELLALTHRSRELKGLSPEALNAVNIAVLERMAASGDTALAEACAVLPREMRPTLFAHALDLVLSDGELVQDEADFLNDLIRRLDLDASEVTRIADVIVLKNRY